MNDKDPSSIISGMAATRPGAYQPTAGEQSMLDSYNTRVADTTSSAGSVGVLSDPNQPTAETQRADLLSKGNSLIDSINSNSNLSGRQKGAQILAAGQGVSALGGTPDLSAPAGLSARQAGNFQVGAFNNRVSALNKQPLAFADGGKPETAEQLLARLSGKYGVSNSSTPAPQPAPAPAPQPQPQTRQPGAGILAVVRDRGKQIDQAAGYAYGGRPGVSEQIRRAGLAHRHHLRTGGEKSHDGGLIQGPGTPTSDSIPAQVAETGEPIAVSTDERIISKAQDDLLLRIANALGFDSVDALLESGTGKPVGPTIKGGKRAAAAGWGLGEGQRPTIYDNGGLPADVVQAGADKMRGQLAAPVQPGGAIKSAAKIASTRGLDYQAPAAPAAAPAQPGDTIKSAASGQVIDGVKYQAMPKDWKPASPLAMLAQGYGDTAAKILPITPDTDARLAANRAELDSSGEMASAAAPQTTPAVSPTIPAAGQPGAAIKRAAAGPSDLEQQQSLHMIDKNLKTFQDVGGGIVAERGQNGRLNVTNVGTGDLTDPNKRAVDDSASALIDQKNSTYNPAAQLARMQAQRFQSDATDPTITDPHATAAGMRGLAIMQAGRGADTQAQLGQMQIEQGKQLAGLRNELLDPATTPERRKAVQQAFAALSGRDDKQIPLEVVHNDELLDPKQPLAGVKKTAFVFDPRTGQSRPMIQPGQANPSDVAARARDAIARGADPKAVNARLRAAGLPEVK